jgi:hypothetical protein
MPLQGTDPGRVIPGHGSPGSRSPGLDSGSPLGTQVGSSTSTKGRRASNPAIVLVLVLGDAGEWSPVPDHHRFGYRHRGDRDGELTSPLRIENPWGQAPKTDGLHRKQSPNPAIVLVLAGEWSPMTSPATGGRGCIEPSLSAQRAGRSQPGAEGVRRPMPRVSRREWIAP